jgi:hypothetical protein
MGFHFTVYADQGQVANPQFLEIPIQGPAPANRLVIVTGVAIVAADEDNWHLLTGGGEDSSAKGDIYIETNYKLRDNDQLIDSATWISLASIEGDDDPDFTLAVDSAEALKRTSNVIQIHVVAATSDDVSLLRVSYQANLLVRTG